MAKEFDLLIIGGGPAGITAGIYAARYKLNVALVAGEFGGYVIKTHIIENYPGFKAIEGMKLAKKWRQQLNALKVKIIEENVVSVSKNDSFELNLKSGKKIKGKSLILAIGTERRKLNIPGEDKFFGKGVSYCAVCDAPLFKEKTVAVIGGSNGACVEALMLAEHASKVYIIYRKEKLRGEPINTERIEKNQKIEVIYNTNVTEILGNQFVEKIKTDTGKEISLQGVFVEAGSMPNTHLINSLGIQTDENGYIKTDSDQRTNIPLVYAAGDITTTKLRQIITACAQGAMAASSAYNDLKK